MSGSGKRRKNPGKAIWIKATKRQLDILDMIDPLYGKTPGDRLLFAFLRWIDEKGEGIYAASEDGSDEGIDEPEDEADSEGEG